MGCRKTSPLGPPGRRLPQRSAERKDAGEQQFRAQRLARKKVGRIRAQQVAKGKDRGRVSVSRLISWVRSFLGTKEKPGAKTTIRRRIERGSLFQILNRRTIPPPSPSRPLGLTLAQARIANRRRGWTRP